MKERSYCYSWIQDRVIWFGSTIDAQFRWGVFAVDSQHTLQAERSEELRKVQVVIANREIIGAFTSTVLSLVSGIMCNPHHTAAKSPQTQGHDVELEHTERQSSPLSTWFIR